MAVAATGTGLVCSTQATASLDAADHPGEPPAWSCRAAAAPLPVTGLRPVALTSNVLVLGWDLVEGPQAPLGYAVVADGVLALTTPDSLARFEVELGRVTHVAVAAFDECAQWSAWRYIQVAIPGPEPAPPPPIPPIGEPGLNDAPTPPRPSTLPPAPSQ